MQGNMKLKPISVREKNFHSKLHPGLLIPFQICQECDAVTLAPIATIHSTNLKNRERFNEKDMGYFEVACSRRTVIRSLATGSMYFFPMNTYDLLVSAAKFSR